jgi:hypothetical protein
MMVEQNTDHQTGMILILIKNDIINKKIEKYIKSEFKLTIYTQHTTIK